jgi:aminoglycoside 3-N-acetyltransferase
MTLPVLTRSQLDEALNKVGVRSGDGLLVHSALQLLGRPEGGLQMYLDALLAAIGPQGTLAVPTFTFEFARGKEYDLKTSPSVGMGAFSEFVRQQPGVGRTKHPMQSLAVIGARAKELAEIDTSSAFESGSVFERLLELDFKLLLLGAEVQAASIVHYSEQRARVPYRYWKEFSGRVNQDRNWTTQTYRMLVRNMDLDPQLRLAPIQSTLESKGQWHSAKLNYGEIACCTLQNFVAAADGLLAADAWALVANKPEQVSK